MSSLPSGTVTFLFTDIEGSTKLAQQYPHDMPILLARHHEILNQVIQAQNGYVFQVVGDSFSASFHSAIDALNATLSAQRLLQNESWTPVAIKVRMGIHTGAAQLNEEKQYSGYAVLALTQRVMSAGHGGQILLSGATHELVRDILPTNTELQDLGERRLKDLLRPEHLYQLNASGLPSTFPPLKTFDSFLNNLPTQLTTFIGREREISEIKQELEQHRLVTLTGSGGTGKTRLSLQVAADLLDQFPNGVWFVELAPLGDPELVPQTILTTMGLVEQQGKSILQMLMDFLREKKVLLILDNCEHLIESCAKLANELLSHSSALKILASSREVLRISGEHAYPVPPLRLPESERNIPLDQLANYEAIMLFIIHAKAANPAFELAAENASAVAEICRRLDGLPLAIELAAARARIFTPKKLLERLSDRLKVLTGGVRDLPARQQTLRGAIDWSYELLGESERTLFARLAIFSGGRSLEAIEAVCGHELDIDTLDGLESLLDKSLIRQEEDFEGQPRFVILETLQAYASERHLARSDWKVTQAIHAEWVLEFAERAEQGLFGEAADVWIKRLQSEEGNIRAVLERCQSGQLSPELGVRLAGALRYYWENTGKLSEGRAWLDSMLSISSEVSPALRVNAICGAGLLAYWQGDWPNGSRWCSKALTIGQELGDPIIVGEAQHFLAHVAQHEGAHEQGLILLRESLKNFLELDHPWGILRSRICLADAERLTQNYDRAANNFQEIIESLRNKSKDVLYAAILSNYGNVLNRQGEFQRALASFREGIERARELENAMILGYLFDGLAGTSILTMQPQRAARLMGASQKSFELAGVSSMTAVDQFDHDYYMAAIREALDEPTFAELMDEGKRMSLEEAASCSLDTSASS
jgi:predicted ATPase/class 3 adenylate cyclase